MRSASICLVVTTCLLALLVSQHFGGRSNNVELASLRFDNAHLQNRINALEAQLAVKAQTQAVGAAAGAAAQPSVADCAKISSTTSSGSTAGATSQDPLPSSFSAQLLDLHSHWDWRSIAQEMLQPFGYVDEGMLQNGVRQCFENGTMYCMRAQIRNNELFITDYRAVFFDRHYAPARIMPLLDVLRRHKIPDVDIVVAAVDEPRVKIRVDARDWSRTIQRYSGALSCHGSTYAAPDGRRYALPPFPATPLFGPAAPGDESGVSRKPPGSGGASLPPPLFSSTINRAHLDLAWPDFSFYMPKKPHKLRTPPWSKLHPQMLRESATVEWSSKISLAVHTGNVGSAWRKKLAEEARRSPDEILVNELFIGDHGKITQTCAQLGLHRRGGFQQHKCYMTFVEQCSYKYLLNSASIGYANKFK